MPGKIDLSITQKGLVLVAVPLLFELLFVAVLVVLLRQADADVEREIRAKTIAQHVSLLTKRYFAALTDVGVYNLTRSKEVKRRYDRDALLVKKQFLVIKDLVEDDPVKLAELEQIEKEVDILHLEMHKLKGKEFGAVPGMAISNELVSWAQTSKALTRLTNRIDQFVEPELEEAKRGAVRRLHDRSSIEGVIWIGIAINVLIALFAARYFGRSISSRLSVLTDNTYRFAKAQPLNPPLEGKDEIAHLDGVFHDVVDHLARVDRQKKEFLAVVSHDLRSPLMSVQGTLTLMTNGILGELSDKAKMRLEDAEADVGRLINLINDLLDTELLESGEFDLHLEDVSVSRLIDRSLKSVESLAEKAQIQLDSQATETNIHADEDRLVQVLVNLLSNAIKFSNAGTSISITTAAIDGKVEIRIKDSGRGIPPALQKEIFERYKQVELADSREKGGSGLGLFICKKIIDAHQGEIGVESTEGAGSSFWIRIACGTLSARNVCA